MKVIYDSYSFHDDYIENSNYYLNDEEEYEYNIIFPKEIMVFDVYVSFEDIRLDIVIYK